MSYPVFCVDIPPTAYAAPIDLVEITPADDKLVEMVAIFLTQNTDFGDAQDEVRPVQIIRGYTTSGTGGSSAVTARPMKRTATHSAAIEVGNTTIASAGTPHTLLTDGWNVRVPYVFHPVDDAEFPQASQGDTTILVRLPETPTDSITVRGSVWFREIG